MRKIVVVVVVVVLNQITVALVFRVKMAPAVRYCPVGVFLQLLIVVQLMTILVGSVLQLQISIVVCVLH